MPLLPLLVLVLIGVGVVTAVSLVARRANDRSDGSIWQMRAAQRLRQVRLTSFAVAVLGMIVATRFGSVGEGAAVAPAVFGVIFLLGCAVGEVSVRSESAARRSADLEVRRVGPFVPRATSALAALCGSLLAGMLLIGALTASADDMGRAGRVLRWRDVKGEHTAGPWPGGAYAWLIAGAATVMLAAFWVAARAVVNRPQVDAHALDLASQDSLRHRSVAGLVGALAVALGAEVLALGLVVAGVTGGAGGGAPTWIAVVHWLGFASALLAVVSLIAGAVSMLRATVEKP